ncbi:YkgJ family cysteine cluster protein [Apibacter raozihei]|uniref:YkgJ family cysteine cluster protein n=1 Tax=Apibacter TaxID=1778601 RepID=UPI000FE340BF|nr:MULTISPECIES: YkgJ family cysteine cluster protein [Apibacter]
MDIEKNKEEAIKRQDIHSKYLSKLKNKKVKNLDQKVLEIHHSVFNKIDCLECANCCKTTGPLFTEKDIERISKHLKMKVSAFIDKYLHKDEDNDWVFNGLPCPFLDSENYCLIYDVRPKACREYPHTDRKKIYQINKITLKNTLICPAAFKVVEEMIKKIPM